MILEGTPVGGYRRFMAALVAAIHDLGMASKDVDGRDAPGHDEDIRLCLSRT
jgi:hypothetical protein